MRGYQKTFNSKIRFFISKIQEIEEDKLNKEWKGHKLEDNKNLTYNVLALYSGGYVANYKSYQDEVSFFTQPFYHFNIRL